MSPQLRVFPRGKAPAASARSAAGAALRNLSARGALVRPGECAHSRSKAQAQAKFNIDFSTAGQIRPCQNDPFTPKRGGVADFLEFSVQDTQLLLWVMDICEGDAARQPLSSLHGGTAGGSSPSRCSQLRE